MIEVEQRIETAPGTVFAVLADGWSYASWVVGASHIRKVDAGWPAVGTRIHHSIGPWPLQVEDVTVVRELEPSRLLVLEARMWPMGKATVRLELAPTQDGATVVAMSELVDAGPGKLLPNAVQAALLRPRNREALSRLADMAVGRARQP
ncbi:SRPBCC family protein [Crossiella sp. SN42]|uniref:SRPBCC family protein n=1 Tax=Crossiella sp. SN42 TaxID=2944808 RepID=UPI00207CD5BD|nr:SRPBCC family protein [Crossiella sp. SN42]MCO1580577.1 SRPBCC family protein [Crossiella sp. SN42]